MRVEALSVEVGTKVTAIDCAHAGRRQASPREPVQIGLPTTSRVWLKAGRRARIGGAEGSPDVGANLIRARPYCGSEPDQEIGWITAHGRDCRG